MSSEKLVLDYLEGRIGTIADGPKKSRHFYNLNYNDDSKNDFIFAIRPGAGSGTAGTIGAITWKQSFEIEVAAAYYGKETNDEALREAVEKIELFFDALTKSMKVKVSPIVNVGAPQKEAPVNDESRKNVSRTYTYDITHRIQL